MGAQLSLDEIRTEYSKLGFTIVDQAIAGVTRNVGESTEEAIRRLIGASTYDQIQTQRGKLTVYYDSLRFSHLAFEPETTSWLHKVGVDTDGDPHYLKQKEYPKDNPSYI